MKTRLFKYSARKYVNLLRNEEHQFAQHFALRVYKSHSIYSFIPKNACTTMRLSLAIANGCIAKKADFNWVHQNNDAFKADLASLATANYTFVILRCPYARLASAYLDKIADLTTEAWMLYDSLDRKIEVSMLTFRMFVKSISKPGVLRSNIHWRPQADYLVYEEYDDYFNLENFSAAKAAIESKADLEIVDARKLSKHGTDGFMLLNDVSYADFLPEDIRVLKKAGKLPHPASLYDDELIAIVKKHFKQDIDLYISLFGSASLLFS